jgi:hypothetical protein
MAVSDGNLKRAEENVFFFYTVLPAIELYTIFGIHV